MDVFLGIAFVALLIGFFFAVVPWLFAAFWELVVRKLFQ